MATRGLERIPLPPLRAFVWTTADGQRLRLDEMSHRHLLNAHRMTAERVEQSLAALHAAAAVPVADVLARHRALLDTLHALEEEIDARDLTPLPPRAPMFGQAQTAVTALVGAYKHLPPGERSHIMRRLAAWLRDDVGTDDAKIAADYLELIR